MGSTDDLRGIRLDDGRSKEKGSCVNGQRQVEASRAETEDHHGGNMGRPGTSLSLEEGNGVGNGGGRLREDWG